MLERNNKLWVFNAGDSFAGNPKWLFTYIYKNKKDIKIFWLCSKKETLKHIKKIGYKAFLYDSKIGKSIMRKAGVYVVEQCKELIHMELEGVKILNLWHGVGCKAVEILGNFGALEERVIKKNIVNFTAYRNNQLFLVTSHLMEEHFIKHCNLDRNKVIQAGYPRCIHQEGVSTFNHNIIKRRKLYPNTKIAVYAPTYRDNGMLVSFLDKALPDMGGLINILQKNNILLILKMHPLIEYSSYYLSLKNNYKDCSNLIFWDNLNDIYEIFNFIDLAIIDYSSIFYDMLASGIKHFIRYMFDINDSELFLNFVFDIKEMTCGRMCNDFDSLLKALEDYGSNVLDDFNKIEDLERIHNLFWSYSSPDSNETIIRKTLDFKPNTNVRPKLYSFDIFDTLISRKVLHPHGIFHYVKYKINLSEINFSQYIIRNFVKVRTTSEARVREYYRKTKKLRNSDRIEVTLDEIYNWMRDTYQLTNEQVEEMKKYELEGELENCIPLNNKIDEIKALKKNNETIILISDMYLPKDFIIKMLNKADSLLGTLPLFLSSEYGVQKNNCKLYIEAFRKVHYDFAEWIHYGDNPNADIKQAEALGIKAVGHPIPKFNKYHNALIRHLNSYDGYLVAALMARFEATNAGMKDIFAYSYASLLFVPYIGWVVKDAINKGYDCLYFISRDGYHLKRIADSIIEAKNLKIKTKYIYGSRIIWRIPSYIDNIDQEFFTEFSVFAGIQNYKSLMKALQMNEDVFNNYFPEISCLIKTKKIPTEHLLQIIEVVRNSSKYHDYLLKLGKSQRKIVLDYLHQEINFEESFAFVEYWGRGYTQDCLTRLLEQIPGKQINNPFYYMRSIYPTKGNSIRYNYTADGTSLIFTEAIFANLHYETIESYVYEDDGVKPVIKSCKNDMELQEAMERNISVFCRDFYSCGLIDEDEAERRLIDFILFYFSKHGNDPIILNSLAHLKDSVEMYGKKHEYAPQITVRAILQKFLYKERFVTKSFSMSLTRSSKTIRNVYGFYNKYIKKIWKPLLKKIIRK